MREENQAKRLELLHTANSASPVSLFWGEMSLWIPDVTGRPAEVLLGNLMQKIEVPTQAAGTVPTVKAAPTLLGGITMIILMGWLG